MSIVSQIRARNELAERRTGRSALAPTTPPKRAYCRQIASIIDTYREQPYALDMSASPASGGCCGEILLAFLRLLRLSRRQLTLAGQSLVGLVGYIGRIGVLSVVGYRDYAAIPRGRSGRQPPHESRFRCSLIGKSKSRRSLIGSLIGKILCFFVSQSFGNSVGQVLVISPKFCPQRNLRLRLA